MKFESIQPFVRFVRYIKIEEKSYFPTVIPLDARIFYSVRGMCIIDIDGKALSIKEGSLIYIPSGMAYTLIPSDTTLLAINFDFTSKHCDLTLPIPPVPTVSEAKAEPLEKIEFSDTVCFNNYCIYEDCQALSESLFRLEKEYIRKLPFYRVETASLLTSVLTRLARHAEQRGTKSSRFNIEAVVSYIQKHYSEPLTNAGIAQSFHYHPNYLSSEFKRSMGMPLHRYLLETRIMKASSLIEAGYENLGEIASLCGFSDINYFIRYFKKIIGTTPAKFGKSRK
ncbi:MAG: helix-turn-helix transcriptional regulator [Clostridia bacterium]|nr:helix-turn-helix transcriptional regulator [Clostridia bacterium]